MRHRPSGGRGEETLAVKGRCLNTGLPREVTLSGKGDRDRLRPRGPDHRVRRPGRAGAHAAGAGRRRGGERYPPHRGREPAAGMDALLAQETGMATHLAEDPIRAVALGAGGHPPPTWPSGRRGVLNLARRRQVEV